MPSLRPQFDGLPEYQPGRAEGPLEALAAGTALLASNETPWGPPEEVIAAMDGVLGLLNRYPSMSNEALRLELAQWHGVGIANIVVGCGGVEIGRLAGNIVLGTGTTAVFGDVSFPEYDILTRLTGATAVEVPMTDFTYDLDAIYAAIDDDTRLAIICNPNNPTSTGVNDAELLDFLHRVPPHCLVLVDEAYWEFTDGRLGRSAVSMVNEVDNLVVLRTFSKAFGLAGIRVGYGIASEPIARAMRKAQLPFSVSMVAEAAAIAVVRQRPQVEERAAELRAERDRTVGQLLDLGLTVPAPHGNFVFIPGAEGVALVDACTQAGIAVRPVGSLGARVTIGTRAENDRFLAVVAVLRSTLEATSA